MELKTRILSKILCGKLNPREYFPKGKRQVFDEQLSSVLKPKLLILYVVSALFLIGYPSLASAGPILGSAQSFAVLGHETVTNGHSDPNPTTQIFGNLGVAPAGVCGLWALSGSMAKNIISDNSELKF